MLRLMGFVFGSAAVLVALLVFAEVPALAPYRQFVEQSVSLLLHRLRNAPGSRVSLEAQPPAPKTGQGEFVKFFTKSNVTPASCR